MLYMPSVASVLSFGALTAYTAYTAFPLPLTQRQNIYGDDENRRSQEV